MYIPFSCLPPNIIGLPPSNRLCLSHIKSLKWALVDMVCQVHWLNILLSHQGNVVLLFKCPDRRLNWRESGTSGTFLTEHTRCVFIYNIGASTCTLIILYVMYVLWKVKLCTHSMYMTSAKMLHVVPLNVNAFDPEDDFWISFKNIANWKK